MVAEHISLVFSGAPGETLEVPGHVSAHRYRLSEDQLPAMPPSPYEYLTIYELDRPPAEPLAALGAELESGAIVLPNSIDAESLRSWAYSAVADPLDP
jgi:hypothetical protein